MGKLLVRYAVKMTVTCRHFFTSFAIAGLLINLNQPLVLAQQASGKANLPHLSDLMNEAMQVHHTKLWLAGHANNWTLAAYELTKIKETIEEVKETIVDIQTSSPQWRRVPVGEMLRTFDSNLNSLEQAIKAKDASKFGITYREITATCNACHMSAGQPQIKIIVPQNGNNAFSNQDFTSENGRP
jgi:hypothetical protein